MKRATTAPGATTPSVPSAWKRLFPPRSSAWDAKPPTRLKSNMAARAIWKGKLKLGSATLPVNLYSAVVDKTVRFHILDEKTETRVKQHMVNPETGEEVPGDEIQKGYQVEPGTFVILKREELEKLQPKPSREIEITRFVSPQEIGSLWYDRPYYLGPDGDAKAYFALADALT